MEQNDKSQKGEYLKEKAIQAFARVGEAIQLPKHEKQPKKEKSSEPGKGDPSRWNKERQAIGGRYGTITQVS